MTDGPETPPRRRRRQATAAPGTPAPRDRTPRNRAAEAPPAEPERPAAPATSKAPGTTSAARRRPVRDSGDGGMRDLVGAGRSQVSLSSALRARDLNRPTDDDLAEADAELVIVRRHWQPADQTSGRGAGKK